LMSHGHHGEHELVGLGEGIDPNFCILHDFRQFRPFPFPSLSFPFCVFAWKPVRTCEFPQWIWKSFTRFSLAKSHVCIFQPEWADNGKWTLFLLCSP
jgi:hypothetical protein